MTLPSTFHAHVYFDAHTAHTAAQLREEVRRRFGVAVGTLYSVPVGPHPKAMFQIRFGRHDFSRLVPWLMINRASLDVLVHPETGDDLLDHTQHRIWLGVPQPLNLAALEPRAESMTA